LTLPDATGLRAQGGSRAPSLDANNGSAAATYNNARGTARSTSASKLTAESQLRYCSRNALMTAAEIYNSVTNGGASDFAEVAAILDRHGPWCLIGGLAVNCYVEPVYTMDANIIVTTENLAAIRDELAAAGFSISEYPHSNQRQKMKSKLNLQFTTDLRFQNFVRRAERRDVLGISVPVADLKDVAQEKTWAWSDRKKRLSRRKKDELDLIRIGEVYSELDELLPKEIAEQLE
jgi:hypothetical protein